MGRFAGRSRSAFCFLRWFEAFCAETAEDNLQIMLREKCYNICLIDVISIYVFE